MRPLLKSRAASAEGDAAANDDKFFRLGTPKIPK
jgi:hypothetical protein